MSSPKKKDVRQLEIPENLAKKAEIVAKKHGYVSLTEFVRDATRRRIEELEAKAEMEGGA
ncbi:ribbon-helix-helix domain-containing protein [Archaeoglobus veneficus]|uniref:Uncharacterized protein n=1 Tax=Archaeoglobus veneficus (strain DSM 11195 / SNP6) TaxID=693661 RepID=F2KR52_ARCVS|nr:ribbon-helix-helix domain-containing protein [Archaeoglobus veneficus]AEA46689.1 hypothetical protein Arcve_0669 [Archaeoglobus veneficus SNP6]